MLSPLPIARDSSSWTYHRTDVPIHYPVSITQVISAVTLTDADRANIERYRPIWEPRGNTVHACLESWLKTQTRPSADDMGDYSDWILPLIDHPFWSKCEVLASELMVYDDSQNWAGTLDLIIRWPDGSHGVCDLKTKSKPNASRQDVKPQLGAGTRAVIDHYTLNPTRNIVLWAAPGITTVTAEDPSECHMAWLDVFDAYCARFRPF